nr:something about silencing protein 10-like [Cherax quadricarinatus]
MGKRRKTGGGSQKQYSVNKVNEENLHSSLLNPEERGYIYDEVDDFEDDQDRLALSMAKKLMARKETSYEQVLGIDASSSDEASGDSEEKGSDEDNLYMEDDIVDEPEFKIPDERAWGKAKWKYIGTDTTDENIQKKLRSQDEEMAKLEEDAARKLQERMAAELQDLVASDLIPQVKRCEEVTSSLSLLMEGVGTRHIESTAVFQYITTKYRLTLNYLCVLCIYMLTKCSQRSLGNHPLVSRLAQFRQLFQGVHTLVYADDVALMCSAPALLTAQETLQGALQCITSWATTWGLEVSDTKSKLLCFTRCRLPTLPSVSLNQMPIPLVSSHCWLGVTLDVPFLTWKKHVAALHLSCARRITLMCRISGTKWGGRSRPSP